MEEWKNTNNTAHRGDTIIAVSNRGRIKLRNGEIKDSFFRQQVFFNGKRTTVHRVIAILFIPKTKEDIKLGRDCIDHKTHNPVNMNINDVRNLRWCTQQENLNFPEAKENQRKIYDSPEWRKHMSEIQKGVNNSMHGRIPWNKGMKGAEYTSHFKDGVRNSNRAKVG